MEPVYYDINEQSAKQAKENHSFSDYKSGSTTAEYRQMVDEFAAKVEKAKESAKSSPEKCAQLDGLLDRYSRRLANWFNKKNSTDARHVSWFISGPANYNMNKQNKWSSATDKLYEEFKEIQSMSGKITGISDVIRSNDVDAEKLIQEKIAKLKEYHAKCKEHNATARKEGTPQLPGYELSYTLREIKRLEGRLTSIRNTVSKATESASVYEPCAGVEVIENTDIMRLQLVFEGKPSEEIRHILKSRGFIWSGRNMAWQRQLTENARYAAKRAIEDIKKAQV